MDTFDVSLVLLKTDLIVLLNGIKTVQKIKQGKQGYLEISTETVCGFR